MWYCWPKYFLSVWFVLTHVSIKKREVLHWIYYCTSAIHKIFSKYILYRKLPFLCFKFIRNSHWQYIWKWHGTNIFSIEVIGRGTKYILVLVQELLDHAVATLLKQIPQSYENFSGEVRRTKLIYPGTRWQLSPNKNTLKFSSEEAKQAPLYISERYCKVTNTFLSPTSERYCKATVHSPMMEWDRLPLF